MGIAIPVYITRACYARNITTMDKYFSRFQDLCIRILSQSDNCQESRQAFKSAKSVPELVTAWQFYWNGVLHEVPEQVLAAFNKFYPEYHDDIARAGIYFNESPATVPSGSPEGLEVGVPTPSPSMVLIGDSDKPVHIEGRHRVYVLGNTPVTCSGQCNVNVIAERANVTLLGNCRCNAEAGTIIVKDRSVFNGKGNVTCYDSATVFIAGGTLEDHGHLNISAYSDSVVSSFTKQRIILYDQATITIRK